MRERVSGKCRWRSCSVAKSGVWATSGAQTADCSYREPPPGARLFARFDGGAAEGRTAIASARRLSRSTLRRVLPPVRSSASPRWVLQWPSAKPAPA